MKSYVIPILKGIITGILEANSVESSKFIIKCSKCEFLGELEHGFSKGFGDIEVVNTDENTISIRCSKCGNEIVSSEF